MSLVPAFEIGVWNAWIFMSSFILQMLAIMLFGKRVWARSGHPADMKKSRTEKTNSIVGNGIWGLATLYSIFLPLKLGEIWFYIGLPVFLVGLLILAVATANFAAAPAEKPATKGAYYFSRHPLYLSMFIIYIGTGIACASWLFILLGIANIFWIRTEVIAEERYCLKKYGDSYRKYMNKTPRWIGVPKAG
ncbi:MAG TPA: isoprenylcysteine carboxylmethyltransferase family protein [Dehalococcoidia bacterium]|nr:isoprenylcysteine carboxylmethyltransferase family protein [Dehalococcoidia bacterium]